jgi:plasmid stabilization system protein ParE
VARYRVDITSRARTQIQEISRWWRANRPLNPGLFREELVDARQQLARLPSGSPAYPSPEHGDVRRLLLRRTRYHVYYIVEERQRVVTVLAVWHTSRGSGPPL